MLTKDPALIRFSDSYKSLQMWTAASELAQRDVEAIVATFFDEITARLASEQGKDEGGEGATRQIHAGDCWRKRQG